MSKHDFVKLTFICKKDLGLERQPTREEFNDWRKKRRGE